ncbi:MAG: hypothetical protein AAF226_03600, partial [Verrucomicrobiota bacterium]
NYCNYNNYDYTNLTLNDMNPNNPTTPDLEFPSSDAYIPNPASDPTGSPFSGFAENFRGALTAGETLQSMGASAPEAPVPTNELEILTYSDLLSDQFDADTSNPQMVELENGELGWVHFAENGEVTIEHADGVDYSSADSTYDGSASSAYQPHIELAGVEIDHDWVGVSDLYNSSVFAIDSPILVELDSTHIGEVVIHSDRTVSLAAEDVSHAPVSSHAYDDSFSIDPLRVNSADGEVINLDDNRGTNISVAEQRSGEILDHNDVILKPIDDELYAATNGI